MMIVTATGNQYNHSSKLLLRRCTMNRSLHCILSENSKMRAFAGCSFLLSLAHEVLLERGQAREPI